MNALSPSDVSHIHGDAICTFTIKANCRKRWLLRILCANNLDRRLLTTKQNFITREISQCQELSLYIYTTYLYFLYIYRNILVFKKYLNLLYLYLKQQNRTILIQIYLYNHKNFVIMKTCKYFNLSNHLRFENTNIFIKIIKFSKMFYKSYI